MNAAERIYVASTHAGQTSSRLAEELARRIEDDIAAKNLPAGGALGSLRELSERYSVGRSVVREAVGLLERRGLGRLRPGPCGGFILATPQPQAIGEQLADYFRASGITARQLQDAREAIDSMAARLAVAVNPTEADRAQREAARSRDQEGRLAATLEIARLAAEPVLLLFVECLNSLTRDSSLTRDFGSAGAQEQGASSLQEGSPANPSAGTLSAAIARELAAEIARTSSVGARLGSEWDLCERFNVSRLTLRQAIRLLQDGGLVECRRGRGNGLVVRDRRASGAIRLVLAYLIGGRLDPMTAGTLLFQLNCFVPALAVSRADAAQRQQLEAALARVESCDPFDRYDLLGLVHCVSRAADSPIIDLFSRCLAAYEARFRPSLAERLPASAQANYFRLVRRLLDGFPMEGAAGLESAKRESSALMLEMSDRRPI
jgi:DNA-binding FadR family transcriptional regulator